MVVVQSFLDNLCRCFPIQTCGEPFGGPGVQSQQHPSQAAVAGEGSRQRASAPQGADQGSGGSTKMAAGLSTTESGNKSAAKRVAERLRGTVDCGYHSGAATNEATEAGADGGVPPAVSSDVSSGGSADSGSPPRPTNSAELAEDREAKQALAQARREAARTAGRRKRSSSASQSQRSSRRAGKRKADIFRSRANTVHGGGGGPGSPGRGKGKDTALADEDAVSVEVAMVDSDDDIVGLRNNNSIRGRTFMCGSGSDRRGSSRAANFGRMMLCFANPIHGSDSDDDRHPTMTGPCSPLMSELDPAPSQANRKSAAAVTPEEAPKPTPPQDNRPKVRTIADDIEELEKLEAERRAEERRMAALERRDNADGSPSIDEMTCGEMTEATGATGADETITSTLYYDAKLDKVVSPSSSPRPPMPLFQVFKVDVDENKPDEIRRIVGTGSHQTLSIMQMWKSGTLPGQQQHPMTIGDADPDAPVRAVKTRQSVVAALGIEGPASQQKRGGGGGFAYAPQAPVLDGRVRSRHGANNGTIEPSSTSTEDDSPSHLPPRSSRPSRRPRPEGMDIDSSGAQVIPAKV